jgi:rhomboid family GlyGly-CTERM serine protease
MSKVVDKLKQLPWITLLFGAVALCLSFLPESLESVFQFDRNRILNGEVWRLFTGHIIHWNSSHLVWDLLVFLACAGLLEWFQRNLFLGFLIGGALLVSLGMLLFLPGMVTYLGLSALDMGLFAALCLQAISYCRFRNRKNLALVWSMVLLGCLLKPILEVVAGGSLFVSNFGAGIEPSPASHVFGILSAFAVLIGTYAWSRLWNRSDCSRSFRSHSSSEISIS